MFHWARCPYENQMARVIYKDYSENNTLRKGEQLTGDSYHRVLGKSKPNSTASVSLKSFE